MDFKEDTFENKENIPIDFNSSFMSNKTSSKIPE